MKIAIDVSPLESGHSIRGVGFYLRNLQKALLEYYPEHEYQFFKQKSEIASDVDIVHYPYFDPFFLTLPLSKQYPTVVTVHDVTPLVFPKHFPAGIKGKLRWQIQKHNLKNVDAIITDSEASKNDIARIAGINKDTLSVAYLAAAEHFKPANDNQNKAVRQKYNLPEKFVLYVGDVTWNKNVPRLIESVSSLEIPLVLAGKAFTQQNVDATNPWNRDLLDVQRRIHKSSRIIPLGFVPDEDMAALYSAATVFVFPSVYEGFGLPILEAMQSGCPTILSKESCMPEVGGDAAYYFDGYDTESLTKAIKTVFKDDTLQKQFSEKGLIHAKEFSWKKTAEENVNVYKRIVDK